jgi:hypothetical protein
LQDATRTVRSRRSVAVRNPTPITAADAAAMVGSTERAVKKALALKIANPTLFDEVFSGRMTLEDAEASAAFQKMKEEFPELSEEDIKEILIVASQDSIDNQCDSDSDKPNCIDEFNSLVRRLSEQRHETEWEIRSCIYGYLYFENLTDGPYIPGPLGD